MAVKLSALYTGRPLPPGRFLVLISARDWVDPRAIVQLEELGQQLAVQIDWAPLKWIVILKPHNKHEP
jgi:hypothetical protein